MIRNLKWLLTCLIAMSLLRVAEAMEYHHEKASMLILSEDGSTLLSQRSYTDGDSEQLRGWNLVNGHPLNLKAINREKSLGIFAIARAGDTLFVAGQEPSGIFRNYQIWCIKNSKAVLSATIVPLRDDSFLAASFQKQTLLLVSGTGIETHDMSGRLLRRVPLQVKSISFSSPILSPDGRWLLAIVGRRREIFDVSTGKLHHVLDQEMEEYAPDGLANYGFSPDGNFVAGGYSYWEIRHGDDDPPEFLTGDFIWRVKDGKLIWKDSSGQFFGNARFFFGRDKVLNGLTIWDIQTRKQVGRLASPWGERGNRPIIATDISGARNVWAVLDTKGNIGIGRK